MDLVLLLTAIVVTVLVFIGLIKIVRATVTTAITIAIIVLLVQLFFGVGADQIWQQVSQVFQAIWQLITGRR